MTWCGEQPLKIAECLYLTVHVATCVRGSGLTSTRWSPQNRNEAGNMERGRDEPSHATSHEPSATPSSSEERSLRQGGILPVVLV
jgi:hypothetical protein